MSKKTSFEVSLLDGKDQDRDSRRRTSPLSRKATFGIIAYFTPRRLTLKAIRVLPFQRRISEEHDQIDRQIRDFVFDDNLAFIRQNNRLFNAIIGNRDERVERTMDGIVLSRLDFDGQNRRGLMIVNQKIDFALAAVVIVKEPVSVRLKLAGDDAFIDGAEIHAARVVQDGGDLAAIQKSGQNAHVIEIKFQQVFARRCQKRKHRVCYRLNVERDAEMLYFASSRTRGRFDFVKSATETLGIGEDFRSVRGGSETKW